MLVIDDNVKEAMAMVEAFSSRGIGTVYYSGAVDKFPSDPLRGSRVVAVDMHLGPTTGNAARDVAQSAAAVKALIAKDNGPYLVVAWTKYPADVAAFRRQVATHSSPPVLCARIEKSAVSTAGGKKFDIAAIGTKLKAATSRAYPLSVVSLWEQLVHEAATDTVRMATPASATKWSDASRAVLSTLLAATGGKASFASQPASLTALLEGLNVVHYDSLERASASLPAKTVEQVERLRQDAVKLKKFDSATAAALNRRLMLGEHGSAVAPGHIYSIEHVRVATKLNLPTAKALRADILNDDRLSKPESAECLPILLEVTPVCDYQNNKMRVARFLAGLAVPASLELPKQFNGVGSSITKVGDFLRCLPPIEFQDAFLTGVYCLIFDARFTISMSMNELVSSVPSYRLRQGVLRDIQSWASSQGARPGFIAVSV